MGDSAIVYEARRLRSIAEAGPIGKRHTSFELYSLLGQCMGLAERCTSGQSFDELRTLVSRQPRRGTNRRYVERRSDEYSLVCRFVFSDLRSRSAERSNASRYAHCLRQARSIGLTGDALAVHLRDNGGVNALFLRRPLKAINVTTKCLQLTKSIVVPKGGAIRLVLQRTADNRYDVLEQSDD